MRDGIVVVGEAPGRPLPGGRVFVEHRWMPGEHLSLEELAPGAPPGAAPWQAPQQAECLTLFSVPLAMPTLGGDSPDTALAFSADGQWLAIGAHTGELLVVDGWSGQIRARRRLAETLVRQVAWSPDGRVLYAAEQSPDATVHALDPSTLEDLASYRLSQDVHSSPLPPKSDLYGVYTLPAAYGLEVLPDGDVLVAATHGWGEGEQRRNASRVLRLRLREGALLPQAAWPREAAADAVLGALTVADGRVAVALRRSAAGPPPADLPIDGVVLLGLPDLDVLGTERYPPLEPYFPGVFIWDSLALGPDWLAAGMGDGRLIFRERPAEGEPRELIEPIGAPVLAGSVPIAASIGFVRSVGERLFAVTSRTAIPYGAAAPELQPPQAHPNENTLWAYERREGRWERRFAWRGAPVLAGLALSPDRDELAVGAGPRQGDDRRDSFGAVLFSLRQPPEQREPGEPSAFCATEGPAFHRLALSSDGRVAVAEVPYRVGDAVHGEYRVTVLR